MDSFSNEENVGEAASTVNADLTEQLFPETSIDKSQEIFAQEVPKIFITCISKASRSKTGHGSPRSYPLP